MVAGSQHGGGGALNICGTSGVVTGLGTGLGAAGVVAAVSPSDISRLSRHRHQAGERRAPH